MIVREPVKIPVGPSLQLQGELTLPADLQPGQKRPAVLLVAGQGALDLDEFIPAPYTGTGQDSKIFSQIADELTGAGCIVLRYTKRGVTGPMPNNLDPATWAQVTSHTVLEDARTALQQLAADPRVSGVSVLGHSEGSIVAGALAATGAPLQGIILIGALAHSVPDVDFLKEVVIPTNQLWQSQGVPHTQALSKENVPPQLQENFQAVDSNGDGQLSYSEVCSALQQEQQAHLLAMYQGDSSEIVDGYPKSYWQSYLSQPSNLTRFQQAAESLQQTPILICQGEADGNTPLAEAVELDRSMRANHLDVTLMTYANQGHFLSQCRADGRVTYGPMDAEPLANLGAWARSHLR